MVFLGSAQAKGVLQENQQFSTLSPLAAASEFSRRVFSPLVQEQLRRELARAPRDLLTHSIRLDDERFDVFVPSDVPEGGVGVLVFASPVEHFPIPPYWKAELDRRGMVLVAARRAGNDQNAIERRLPLALHALAEIQARYPVDNRRVYISGFSGGSRVAQRLVFAYPDVFKGALLIGGSDPPGSREGGALPAPELTRVLQRETRFVFATGSRDFPNRTQDEKTQASMRELCMAGIRSVAQPRIGHWVPDARGFAKAMRELERPVELSAAQTDCERRLTESMRAAQTEIRRRVADGELDHAWQRLDALDTRLGNLAHDFIIEQAHHFH